MVLIQWFPGHMSKARRQVQENLKHVDIIMELVDARLPLSSRNPMLDKIIGTKPRLIIINKKDLGDELESQKWVHYFQSQGILAIKINAKEQQTVKKLTKAAKAVLAEQLQRASERGIQNKAIRTMIIGIPNVGKSTLMNRLAGKKIAITGNKPGVTKGQQWLKTNEELEILDTPGILWPKFEDQTVALKLALTGAIKDDLIPKDEITIFGLTFFKKNYPSELQARYKLSEAQLALSAVDLIVFLTKKMGFRDDYDRFYDLFVKDVRDGKLGTYTLDRLADLEDDENGDN
ncbi:ribosome biogenesis GTPase A [Lactococcus hodotermopsidis]|uniref:Ribosome biogenesis GTPase A n=1 Tax=Pseudolactococcus hodotermopsidis TaxID=2709157 RepID=A0A6A0BBE1_9LACT|nr:ribosome biogenesis GTPase YlqF [Lactococcus hodotermopsidis]GFH41983.1 ribosome biogenesis GTPase A [Lactococcus hodotermopsidis]